MPGEDLTFYQMTKLFQERHENVIGNGDNAGYQHFQAFSAFPVF